MLGIYNFRIWIVDFRYDSISVKSESCKLNQPLNNARDLHCVEWRDLDTQLVYFACVEVRLFFIVIR